MMLNEVLWRTSRSPKKREDSSSSTLCQSCCQDMWWLSMALSTVKRWAGRSLVSGNQEVCHTSPGCLPSDSFVWHISILFKLILFWSYYYWQLGREKLKQLASNSSILCVLGGGAGSRLKHSQGKGDKWPCLIFSNWPSRWTDQELANYGPTGQLPVFVHKVLLEHSYTYLCIYLLSMAAFVRQRQS